MTAILARLDRSNNTPVVFIADSVDYAKGHVLAWVKGEPQLVNLSYYHMTGALSAADEEVMRQRYARHFQDNDVVLRQRLPRQTREVESILAKPTKQPKASPLPVVQPEAPQLFNKRVTDLPATPETTPEVHQAVPAPTPEQLMAVLEQQRVDFTKQMAEANQKLADALALLATSVQNRPQKTRKGTQPAAKKTAPKALVSAPRRGAAKPIPTKV